MLGGLGLLVVLAMGACGPACSGCLCVLLFNRHGGSAQLCDRFPWCVQGHTGDGGQLVDCGLLRLCQLLQILRSQAVAAPPGAEQQQGAAASAAIVAPCIVPTGPGLAVDELVDHFDGAVRQLADIARQLAAAAAERRHAATGSVEPPQAAAAAASTDPALAVRRARALALRSCANPRCSNLGGASEGALKGRKCGGCRVATYCGDACCRADWRAHRRTCKLLQREPGSGV